MDFFSVFTNNPLNAALAALFLAWLAYRLHLSRDVVARRRAAADAIASAFRPDLDALVQRGGNAGLVLTDAALKRHESAINSNVGSLSLLHGWFLRRAWRKLAYQKQRGQSFGPSYHWYFDAGSLDKRRELLPSAIKHVQCVISIATLTPNLSINRTR